MMWSHYLRSDNFSEHDRQDEVNPDTGEQLFTALDLSLTQPAKQILTSL
jgi:hypothetical protein